jgi:hypothetical protein
MRRSVIASGGILSATSTVIGPAMPDIIAFNCFSSLISIMPSKFLEYAVSFPNIPSMVRVKAPFSLPTSLIL